MVFGPEQPINLRLLDIAPMMQVLNGVVMELEDLALPLVKGFFFFNFKNILLIKNEKKIFFTFF